MTLVRRLPALLLCAGLALVACGGGGSGARTNTGESCTAASQCFSTVAPGELVGDAVCLDAVPGGYCTHGCTQDTDCCAANGECPLALAEVCAPFESTGQMDCFLSCEDADVSKSGYTDSNAYCANFASAAFICRSTGGGAKNRKVCVPG